MERKSGAHGLRQYLQGGQKRGRGGSSKEEGGKPGEARVTEAKRGHPQKEGAASRPRGGSRLRRAQTAVQRSLPTQTRPALHTYFH